MKLVAYGLNPHRKHTEALIQYSLVKIKKTQAGALREYHVKVITMNR